MRRRLGELSCWVTSQAEQDSGHPEHQDGEKIETLPQLTGTFH